MKKSLVSLVTMVKNEAASIEKIIESAAYAVDRVDLLDTGSTDGTMDIAEMTCSRLGIALSIVKEPFVDFATTRNRALQLAERNAVFGFQMSGDETLHGASVVREFCESRLGAAGQGSNLYPCAVKIGAGIIYHTRLVRLGSPWRWKYVVHEAMECDKSIDVVKEMIPYPDVFVEFKESDPERKHRRFYRDLELLSEEYKKDPNDSRIAFYLAQTLFALGLYADSMRLYLARTKMGGWEEERYQAFYRAAFCALHLEEPWERVQDMLISASAARPNRAEALSSLAEMCYGRQDYGRAFLFASQAARLPFPVGEFLGLEPEVYRWRALNLVQLSAFFVNELEAGEAAVREIIRRRPDEPRFLENLALYERLKRQRSRTELPEREHSQSRL